MAIKLRNTATPLWIASLATSVLCCSVLFVFFAFYFFQIKEDLAIAHIRIESLEQRISQLSTTVQMMGRTTQQVDPAQAAQGQNSGAAAEPQIGNKLPPNEAPAVNRQTPPAPGKR